MNALREFQIKIDKGVTRANYKSWNVKVTEAIRGMAEGDSFEVPNHGAYNQALAIANKLGAKMSGHRLEDGETYRIWLDDAPKR
jgi:hypothetical protein